MKPWHACSSVGRRAHLLKGFAAKKMATRALSDQTGSLIDQNSLYTLKALSDQTGSLIDQNLLTLLKALSDQVSLLPGVRATTNP